MKSSEIPQVTLCPPGVAKGAYPDPNAMAKPSHPDHIYPPFYTRRDHLQADEE